MKIGYIRVSSKDQNTDRQVKALKEYGVEKLYSDKQSGKNTNRPQLLEMMEYVRNSDVVIVNSISRFARNTKDLLNLVDQLASKDVEFVSLKENIDTTTPTGRFMLTIFAAVAELEREYINERQREGIEVAKEKGKKFGRPSLEIKEEYIPFYQKWKNGEITAREAMEGANLKRTSFYKIAKELETKGIV